MNKEQLIDELEEAVTKAPVGIELYFDSFEWRKLKARGWSFADYAKMVLDRYI
jgi:hypothetical protein